MRCWCHVHAGRLNFTILSDSVRRIYHIYHGFIHLPMSRHFFPVCLSASLPHPDQPSEASCPGPPVPKQASQMVRNAHSEVIMGKSQISPPSWLLAQLNAWTEVVSGSFEPYLSPKFQSSMWIRNSKGGFKNKRREKERILKLNENFQGKGIFFFSPQMILKCSQSNKPLI